MADRIIYSKAIQLLNPGTYEYGILYAKRNFADMIKLRIWRPGGYPRKAGWALDIIIRLYKTKQKNIGQGKKAM